MNGKEAGQDNVVLKQEIAGYLLWMIDQGYTQRTWALHERLLNHFAEYTERRAIGGEHIFTLETLEAFQRECQLTHASTAVRSLARYLYQQQKISRPLRKGPRELPSVYEEYLRYYAKTRQAHRNQHLLGIRRLLASLHDFLAGGRVDLAAVRIEHLDAVLAGHGKELAPKTRRIQRSRLRGFLRYLYQVRGILAKDLAPFIVGAPQYADAKPPKFLRGHEVRRLFGFLTPATPGELRTHAMLHLAYSLGLRPKEISLIRLDDIAFSEAEISLPDRKCQNPIRLPLPEAAVKAVAAYIIGARPDSARRTLFLGLHAPYSPVSAATVSHDLRSLMHKAGLPASAYWLRHTYAQNLLETNTSIFAIKEMMGHDRIQTTRRYLHIHTSLMREVLFDERL